MLPMLLKRCYSCIWDIYRPVDMIFMSLCFLSEYHWTIDATHKDLIESLVPRVKVEVSNCLLVWSICVPLPSCSGFELLSLLFSNSDRKHKLMNIISTGRYISHMHVMLECCYIQYWSSTNNVSHLQFE
jgi:uncharacterized sodium:solute symporter family permease YidK